MSNTQRRYGTLLAAVRQLGVDYGPKRKAQPITFTNGSAITHAYTRRKGYTS